MTLKEKIELVGKVNIQKFNELNEKEKSKITYLIKTDIEIFENKENKNLDEKYYYALLKMAKYFLNIK